MSELKPCPFCGGKVRLSTADRGASFAVWCGGCGGTDGGEYLSKESAIKHWNRRPLEDELVAALEGFVERGRTPGTWVAAKDALAKARGGES